MRLHKPIALLNMNDIAKETISANLEQEMRRSYLDYAMSVIVGRALPDVRDGFMKPHTQPQNTLIASEFFEEEPAKIRVRKCELSTSYFTTCDVSRTASKRQFLSANE
jgi:hypothetical protein